MVDSMDFFGFHPIIAQWFQSRFAGPTEPQERGWPHIAAGEHTLIAAPTGSGKTLTAFLACIDRLLKEAVEHGLPDETRVVYVSPLRALSNDMHRNLEVPLAEILALAEEADGIRPTAEARTRNGRIHRQRGLAFENDGNGPPSFHRQSAIRNSKSGLRIRVGLRTGDSTSSQRQSLVRRPPHILVSTPESLYLMLTAAKARETLRTVETVIVDEIHALVRDKRGSHLALTLERLEALTGRRLQRIGLSATQRPIERTAAFLVGGAERLRIADRGMRIEDSQEPCCGSGALSSPPLPLGEGRGEGERCDDAESWSSTSSGFPPHPNPLPGGEGTRVTTSASIQQSANPNPQSAIRIVDVGHKRDLDLGIEVPPSELGAVCMHEQWAEVHARLVELISEHRSTLIFVNTRRMAERVTHQLTELMGEDVVSSHHGSISGELRLRTEQRLKNGQLKAVVATASLELGLDIGYIDLVIQLGAPRSIAAFLQRIGRSGHSLGLTPKGRIFAMTRDELYESMALMRAIGAGRLDEVTIPEAPLDVLAQQIVAEVAGQEWDTDELFALCRRAYPYRNLTRAEFDRTVEFLSEGITHAAGRSRVYLHHDHVQKRLRARAGARLAAISNGGAIPDVASYRVVAEPDNTVVGSLDEEFAVESMRGDIFLLGNTSWRLVHVRGGDVLVADAHGAPPTIPFWQGEAPGRSFDFSAEVSRFREDLEARLEDPAAAERWLVEETHCTEQAAQQAVLYASAQKAAIGLLPSQKRVVFERFFDETGGMQLVVHAPFGGAICRAWGFAMRKRFCRSFDFELQATADDDGFILSLGPQHSFPIESLFPMLTPRNARGLLEQAVLTVPMFQVRWRWNVTRALLVLRMQNGKAVPPAIKRFRADDLLTAVFPRLTGCQEEHTGDIPLPDHPLAKQTMEDCLHELLDIDGLERVLGEIERGEIQLIARDTREPSPFSYELLNSNPYAFLDGGEVQERRTRAVSSRRTLSVESVSDLGRLDAEAIAQVRAEAQPLVRSADELHDALLGRIVIPVEELADCEPWYRELAEQQRAATVTLPDGRTAWVSAERLPAALAVFPDLRPEPAIGAPATVRHDWESSEARVAMIRGMIEVCGPITAADLAARLSIAENQADAALEALEGEGVVLRGHFTPREERESGIEDRGSQEAIDSEPEPASGDPRSSNLDPQSAPPIEWCHRRLLARIHRLTLQGLRQQIEPVSVEVYQRYLTRLHGLVGGNRRTGTNGLFETVAMLQGLDIPAVSWERDVLPARVEDYKSEWLDELCLTGEVGWGRLFPPKQNPDRGRPMASLTRVAPISLYLRSDVDWLTAFRPKEDVDQLSSPGEHIVELLARRGAMFAADLQQAAEMLPSQLEDVLGELVTRGLLTADGFGGLRQLIAEKSQDGPRRAARVRPGLTRRRRDAGGTGRWSLWREPRRVAPANDNERRDDFAREAVEQWAWQLLRRWGVVFRDLLTRESGAPSWFELLQVYRRLEARGEIRGGRFIAGVAGEQFGLGESVRELRALRDEGPKQELVILTAADPLNLVGIITKHARVPSTASNRMVYLDGVPVAALQGGELSFLGDLPDDARVRIISRVLPGRAAMPRLRALFEEKKPGADDQFKASGEAGVSPPERGLLTRGIPRPRIS